MKSEENLIQKVFRDNFDIEKIDNRFCYFMSAKDENDIIDKTQTRCRFLNLIKLNIKFELLLKLFLYEIYLKN